MPPVKPADAKRAIITFATWLVGAFEALEGMEQGQHPVAAIKDAVKKAKKRKKKARRAKKALEREKGTIDAE